MYVYVCISRDERQVCLEQRKLLKRIRATSKVTIQLTHDLIFGRYKHVLHAFRYKEKIPTTSHIVVKIVGVYVTSGYHGRKLKINTHIQKRRTLMPTNDTTYKIFVHFLVLVK